MNDDSYRFCAELEKPEPGPAGGGKPGLFEGIIYVSDYSSHTSHSLK